MSEVIIGFSLENKLFSSTNVAWWEIHGFVGKCINREERGREVNMQKSETLNQGKGK